MSRLARRLLLSLLPACAIGIGAWYWLQPERSDDSYPEFARAAANLRNSDDQFFGRAALPGLLDERKAIAADNHLGAIDLDLKLFAHHLRLGEVDAAIAEADRALQTARGEPSLQTHLADFYYWRGLGYLRRAEQTNCVAKHRPACCIWPLQGDGLHTDREPAQTAMEAFLEVLARQPKNLGARWLANVAAKACSQEGAIPPPLRWPHRRTDPGPVPRFVDRAADLGIDVFDLSGGAVIADVDGNGFLDLVSTSSDPEMPMHLFLHRGDGSFVDGTAAAGLSHQLGGLNCMAVDYDGDGDQDLFVLRGAWLKDLGRIRNSLLQNDGHGHFRDVTTAAGLALPACPTQAAAWGDFDGDGDLDLFVGNESRREQLSGMPPGGDYPSQLFRNNGNGTFTDVAAEAGTTNDRYCKGACVGDFDDDGDLDLYVSNIGKNRLYRNDGDLHFTDVAPALRVTEPSERSFACWFFDYDNDGKLDLFVAGYQASIDDVAADMLREAGEPAPGGGTTPRLYHNLGGRFEDVTARMGLQRVTLPMGANYCDVDADGWLDIYLATGEPGYQVLIPNMLLHNEGGKGFRDATEAAGLGHLQKGHGVAFADLDHDGDQDLFHQLGGFYPGDGFYNALFENTGTGHLLVLELEGTRSNRAAYGARIQVELETPHGPRVLHRAVGCVSSFGSSTIRQEIGLGDAVAVSRVVVRWPAGSTQEWRSLPCGGHVALIEGQAEAHPLARPHVGLGQRH
jgi:tetratricopeptide (TPR) repeat protein